MRNALPFLRCMALVIMAATVIRMTWAIGPTRMTRAIDPESDPWGEMYNSLERTIPVTDATGPSSQLVNAHTTPFGGNELMAAVYPFLGSRGPAKDAGPSNPYPVQNPQSTNAFPHTGEPMEPSLSFTSLLAHQNAQARGLHRLPPISPLMSQPGYVPTHGEIYQGIPMGNIDPSTLQGRPVIAGSVQHDMATFRNDVATHKREQTSTPRKRWTNSPLRELLDNQEQVFMEAMMIEPPMTRSEVEEIFSSSHQKQGKPRVLIRDDCRLATFEEVLALYVISGKIERVYECQHSYLLHDQTPQWMGFQRESQPGVEAQVYERNFKQWLRTLETNMSNPESGSGKDETEGGSLRQEIVPSIQSWTLPDHASPDQKVL